MDGDIDPFLPLSAEQLDFAREFAGVFQKSIEIVTKLTPTDDFDEYLSCWAVALGALGHEVFLSTTSLLEKGHSRAAWMLTRPLIDYHIRLRYYVVQSKTPRSQFEKTNRKSVKNYLMKTKAYVDWSNAGSKSYAILKGRPFDFDSMEPTARRDLEAELSKEHTVYQRNLAFMLDSAVPDAEEHAWLHTSHLWLSGYLHGDQITLSDLVKIENERLTEARWMSSSISPIHTLGEATFYLLRFLETIEEIKGWAYGLHWGWKTAATIVGHGLKHARTSSQVSKGGKAPC